MKNLGNSIERLKNGGALLGFWILVAVVVFFAVFALLMDLDDLGKTMIIVVIVVFIPTTIYMFFKSKTEIDIRENGIYVRNISKSYEILYSEISGFDKTERIGKSGKMVYIFYLLVIEKKGGLRITCPFRLLKDSLVKIFEAKSRAISTNEAVTILES